MERRVFLWLLSSLARTPMMLNYWEETLDHMVTLHPDPNEVHPQNQVIRAARRKFRSAAIRPKIRLHGEKRKELERNPDFHAHHWIVEITHSFLNRFRKLLPWMACAIFMKVLSSITMSKAYSLNPHHGSS